MFAGSGRSERLDGEPLLSSFDCPKGIAINSNMCMIGDLNCTREVVIQGLNFIFEMLFVMISNTLFENYQLYKGKSY